MPPLDDLGRGLRALRDRLAVGPGAEALEVVREQLARPEPPRPLAELQQELDSLVGLTTVGRDIQRMTALDMHVSRRR